MRLASSNLARNTLPILKAGSLGGGELRHGLYVRSLHRGISCFSQRTKGFAQNKTFEMILVNTRGFLAERLRFSLPVNLPMKLLFNKLKMKKKNNLYPISSGRDDEEKAMYALAIYLNSIGWSCLVGQFYGIETEGGFNHRLVFRFTGKKISNNKTKK